jgi:8-oxo-dGTP pyrophosphatase MutT (NUDIX family)
MHSHIPEFGTKRANEERRDGGCGVVFDPAMQKYAVGYRAKDELYLLFSGGVETGESVEEGILREVREESGLHNFQHVEKIAEALTHYHNRAKKVNRVAHATCLLVALGSADTLPVQLEAHETFVLRWVTPEELVANWQSQNGDHGLDHWLYFLGIAVGRAVELGYDTTSGLSLCAEVVREARESAI